MKNKIKLNIMVVGESGVGKTSFVKLFGDHFAMNFFSLTETTIKLNCEETTFATKDFEEFNYLKEYQLGNKTRTLNLTMIDTPGWANS
jgi:septin family protein